MVKEIIFDYEKLNKFIEEINTKLQDRFSFYLVDNKLSLFDSVYDISNNNIKNIEGKIIESKEINKELSDSELIKQLEDNYLFINLVRIKFKMNIRQLQQLVSINEEIEKFYSISDYKYDKLIVKFNKLVKIHFTSNLKFKNHKELFKRINDLSEEIYKLII